VQHELPDRGDGEEREDDDAGRGVVAVVQILADERGHEQNEEAGDGERREHRERSRGGYEP
jgi:hypothetical protein